MEQIGGFWADRTSNLPKTNQKKAIKYLIAFFYPQNRYRYLSVENKVYLCRRIENIIEFYHRTNREHAISFDLNDIRLFEKKLNFDEKAFRYWCSIGYSF